MPAVSHRLPAGTIPTAAGGITTLLRFVDAKWATVEFLAVHAGYRIIPGFFSRVGDETEAAGAAGLSVQDHLGLGDFTKLGERLVEAVVTGVPTQISNKQFLRHISISLGAPRLSAPAPLQCEAFSRSALSLAAPMAAVKNADYNCIFHKCKGGIHRPPAR